MSQTVKPGYKQTKVGVIPEEWEVKEIGSVCGTITTGKLDANAMRPDGPYRFYTCAKDYYQIDKFAFDCEALLISGNGAHVGYIHYYHGKFNAYQRTYVLFGFRDDIKFIQHYLSENFKKRIEVEVKAGGTPYITRPTIAETALPIPPIPEQRAIATALSDVDALLAALDRLIAKQRDLKQAAMQQLLTGQTRLPGFTGKWETKTLPDVSRFRGGKAHEQYIADHGRFVCVNSKFISTEGKVRKYSTANFCSAKAKDILMVMSDLPNGKALAKTFVADQDDMYAVNQRVCALTPFDDYCAEFLAYVLDRNPYFLKFDDGVSQTHLLNRVFQKCPVFVPPTKSEQTAIATVLSDMDLELAALEQRRDKTRALKQGMMQELLTGRTRLV
jgi:type I restriction enzyme S subunit